MALFLMFILTFHYLENNRTQDIYHGLHDFLKLDHCITFLEESSSLMMSPFTLLLHLGHYLLTPGVSFFLQNKIVPSIMTSYISVPLKNTFLLFTYFTYQDLPFLWNMFNIPVSHNTKQPTHTPSYVQLFPSTSIYLIILLRQSH